MASGKTLRIAFVYDVIYPRVRGGVERILFLEASKVFAFPSTGGFGMAVLEAMAAGGPSGCPGFADERGEIFGG